jgi:predicted DsbA family dithiol-disulfide isomerase
MSKKVLPVMVFSDIICPFCYIGYLRLQKLMTDYDVKVNWCFVEIHPETPPEGRPLSDLDYPEAQWQQMMQSLNEMAQEEGVVMNRKDMTYKSRNALLLAEASKTLGREPFYQLHNALFEAYFSRGLNIGDQQVLTELATAVGMPQTLIQHAWREEQYATRLEDNLQVAAKMHLRSVPSYLIGEQTLVGAVSLHALQSAAVAATAAS